MLVIMAVFAYIAAVPVLRTPDETGHTVHRHQPVLNGRNQGSQPRLEIDQIESGGIPKGLIF